jgi:hypothetical protein
MWRTYIVGVGSCGENSGFYTDRNGESMENVKQRIALTY